MTARVSASPRALDVFEKAVTGGFFCYPFFLRDSWIDPLRADARFNAILRNAEARMRDAEYAFESHPGSRVLGVGVRR